MLLTRYTFGALIVILDSATGAVCAVVHHLFGRETNADGTFSRAYINAAVHAARMAWESTADH